MAAVAVAAQCPCDAAVADAQSERLACPPSEPRQIHWLALAADLKELKLPELACTAHIAPQWTRHTANIAHTAPQWTGDAVEAVAAELVWMLVLKEQPVGAAHVEVGREQPQVGAGLSDWSLWEASSAQEPGDEVGTALTEVQTGRSAPTPPPRMGKMQRRWRGAPAHAPHACVCVCGRQESGQAVPWASFDKAVFGGACHAGLSVILLSVVPRWKGRPPRTPCQLTTIE